MKFKYSEFLGLNNSKIFRPTVPIIIKNKSKLLYTEGLVDSGADYNILPIEIADFLNIKIDYHQKRSFNGAGGNKFSVYSSSNNIEILLRQNGFRSIKWETKVYFTPKQSEILLGQIGFLEMFKATLDGSKKELELIKP